MNTNPSLLGWNDKLPQVDDETVRGAIAAPANVLQSNTTQRLEQICFVLL
jgi:hypothetical protein